MVTLNNTQLKAVSDFIELCDVPRLRQALIMKLFSDIINGTSFTKKELEDISFLYMLLENINHSEG